MKWLEDFTLVMKSSVTALRERIEDPERMLYQLICDMEEELEAVRTAVAGAIADEIVLARQRDDAVAAKEKWRERAEAAMKRGDETGARAALEQRMQSQERAETLSRSYNEQHAEVEKLGKSFRDLEDKIRQARHKQTLLCARLVRAQSSDRIQRALDNSCGESAFAQFRRLERRVERAEAMNEAYDRLDGRDPTADELEAKFEAEERRKQLETELEDLRRRTAPQES